MAIHDRVENTDFQNIYSSLISGMANWIGTDLIPRCKEILVSTYSKSVETINNRKKIGGQKWFTRYPFISVDPQQFEIEPGLGRMFHNYPSFNTKFATRLYRPNLYDDGNTIVSPVLNRFKGNMEVTIWASSVYEMLDIEKTILQQFAGYGRPIYPQNLNCFLIIPKELEDYTWTNEYTKETFTMDWSGISPSSEYLLIRNINQNRLTYPFTITPWMTLTSITENKEPWGGGGDSIGEHRLTVNIEWECSLPVYMVVLHRNNPDYPNGLVFRLAINVNYLKNPVTNKYDIEYYKSIIAMFANQDTSSIGIDDVIFDKQYNYIITAHDKEELDAGNNIIITLPDPVNIVNDNYIQLYSKYGYLDPIYHYGRVASNQIVLYSVMMSNLMENDVITFIIYKETFPKEVL